MHDGGAFGRGTAQPLSLGIGQDDEPQSHQGTTLQTLVPSSMDLIACHSIHAPRRASSFVQVQVRQNFLSGAPSSLVGLMTLLRTEEALLHFNFLYVHSSPPSPLLTPSVGNRPPS